MNRRAWYTFGTFISQRGILSRKGQAVMGLDKIFLEECGRAGEIISSNLSGILRDNADTDFGRKFHFSRIADAGTYRKTVPLSDYERFGPYIAAMREGKTNVLTAYPLAGFCVTSGTEGHSKYIPVTREALRRYGNGFQIYQDKIYRETGGRRLFVNTFRTDISGQMEPELLYSEIYYRYLFEEGFLHPDDYAGGKPLFFQRRPGNSLYAKVWAAVLERDLTILESVFLYDVLIFFHYLESHWKEITGDIRKRTIPRKHGLPEETAVSLLSMKADEERLSLIERECEKGFEKIAQRLWGRLRLVSGISTPAYYTEDRALRRYIGDIPQYYLCYCASECYMGMPAAENDFRYILLPRNAFYEFLPFKEGEREEARQEETRLIQELETGKYYEMVVTNYSGLYRYRMGDIVKVCGFCGESPMLEFAFRRRQALNIAGEKMSICQIEAAVRKLEEYGIHFQEYSIGASSGEVPGRYLVAATLAADAVQAGGQQIARWLDSTLKKQNSDYEDLRRMHYISRPYVRLFEREAYDRLSKAAGFMRGHHKPRHIAQGGFSMEMFEAAEKCGTETAGNE